MKCEGFVVHYALGGMIDALDGEQRAAVLGAAYAKARGKSDYKLPEKYAFLQFVVEGIVNQSQKVNESINERKKCDAERQRQVRQRRKLENETDDDDEKGKSRHGRNAERAGKAMSDRSRIAKNDADAEVDYENGQDVTRTACDNKHRHNASRGRVVTSRGVTRTACDAGGCHKASTLNKEINKEINKCIPQTPKGVLMDFDDDEFDDEEASGGGTAERDGGAPGLRRADRTGGEDAHTWSGDDGAERDGGAPGLRRADRTGGEDAHTWSEGDGAERGEGESDWEDEVAEIAAAIVERHGNKAGADGFKRSLKRYLAKNPETDAGEIAEAHVRWCESGAWNPGYEPKLKNWLWGGEWRHEPPEKKKAAPKAEEDEFYTGASL